MPIPSAATALSTEECAWSDAYTAIGVPPAIPRRLISGSRRCRAAARAVKVLVEAVSWMRPNHSGRPRSRASQRVATSSSSVAAGQVRQSIPLTLSAAAASSPAMPGSDPVIPK